MCNAGMINPRRPFSCRPQVAWPTATTTANVQSLGDAATADRDRDNRGGLDNRSLGRSDDAR